MNEFFKKFEFSARRPEPREDATPSYYVEHLATFAVGRQVEKSAKKIDKILQF